MEKHRDALTAALGPEKVVGSETTAYSTALRSYFSLQQQSVQPGFIVLPQDAQDVSSAVSTLVRLHEEGQPCPSAVRSGGHTSWAGSSSIEGGAVIDLRALDSIQLALDKETVSVGVGATWGDVYEYLDPLGLSVNGGRASTPGVGGLTLGGGLSYTSPRYGWTCDTVTQFEIVLADGSIVDVDATSHPDLFWALKGGVNNFGIITRIVFKVFPQGPVWSGTVYSLATQAEQVIQKFVEFNSATSYDEYASVITSFTYNQTSKVPVVANLLQYTKGASETPSAFRPFFKVPTLHSTIRVASMAETAKVTASLNPAGLRTTTSVTTLVSTEPVLKAAYDSWNAAYPALTSVAGILFCLILEPLPPAIYKRHAHENALGLADRTESLVVVELFASWTDVADDDLVNGKCKALLHAINEGARKLGGLDPYIFANYAAKDQDVIGSYGADSVSRMRRVRQEVDPRGIFTKLVPGGYKIPTE